MMSRIGMNRITILVLILYTILNLQYDIVECAKSKKKKPSKVPEVEGPTQDEEEPESHTLLGNATISHAHDFSPFYHNHCKVHPDKCGIHDLSFDSLSKQNLIHALENDAFLQQEQTLLTNHHIYYVVITIKKIPHNDNSSLAKQYEELDAFILERPWWKVQQYPVIYQRQSRPLPLLLEHVPRFVTEVSKKLLAIHFPPKEKCLENKLYIRTGMGSWGIDIGNIDDFFNRYPGYIHSYYSPSKGKRAVQGYVEKNKAGCAEKFNIRTCSFLETTNCSYPESFMKFCGENDCVKTGIYDAKNRSYVGEYDTPGIPHDTANHYFPNVAGWKSVHTHGITTHHPYIINATTVNFVSKLSEVTDANVYQYHWKFDIAYKYNYHLGVRVQEFLQEFYAMYHRPEKSESFTVHDHCVGVHIRKGDRTIPGVDMVEWCKNHTHINSKGEREFYGNWTDGYPMRYGNWADMGCHYAMPFGSVNLQHIVNGSFLLVNETLYSSKHRLNILIMTDELSSLDKDLVEFHKTGHAREKVRIIVFPTKLTNVHKSRMTWEATTEWWAGIEAMRHCSAYMMHTASAASSAIFNAMCYSNVEGYLKCPPALFFQ